MNPANEPVESPLPNPYLPPQAPLMVREDAASAEALPPVPFEDEALYPAFWPRLWATLKLGYAHPFELADRIPVTNPILPAWLCFLSVQLPFSLLGAVLALAIPWALSGFSAPPRPLDVTIQLGSVVAGATLGMFLSGAIMHGCLWLFGGTRHKQGIGQTIRTMGYGGALFAPVGWIPLLGGLLALVWSVFIGLGLARVHRTDAWRGLCAVFLPIAVGLLILAVVVVIVVVGLWRGFPWRP